MTAVEPWRRLMNEQVEQHLDQAVQYQDWPTPGVLFQDLNKVLGRTRALSLLADKLICDMAEAGVENLSAIAAIESRGFILGAALAGRVGCAFMPVRKAGKTPGQTLKMPAATEYSDVVLEVQFSDGWRGQSVILVDDVLATGGTVLAAVQLITALGAEVVAVAVVLEIAALNGRQRLDGIPVFALRTV